MDNFNNVDELKKLYKNKLEEYNEENFNKVDKDWEFWKNRIKSANFNINDWALNKKESEGTASYEHFYCLPQFLEQGLRAYSITSGMGPAYVRKVYMNRDANIYMKEDPKQKKKVLIIDKEEAKKIFEDQIKPILISLVKSKTPEEAIQITDKETNRPFHDILFRIVVLLYPTCFYYRFTLPKIEGLKVNKDSGTCEKNNETLKFIANKLGLNYKALTRKEVWGISAILHTLYEKQNPSKDKKERVDEFQKIDTNISKQQNSLDIIPLNQILYGPPGTGKTYSTIIKALEIIHPDLVRDYEQKNLEERKSFYTKGLLPKFNELKRKGQIKFITFHQNYSYEDFIQGYKPVLKGNSMIYDLIRGPFYEIVKKAEENKNGKYVLIIDEINRGNISKIFGELITLIEEDKRIGKDHALTIPLMYDKKEFGIPDNLYIIGTMNTTDKSIALVDIALRRRFTFEEIFPNPELIKNKYLSNFLQKLNDSIERYLDKDHKIGHSYFIDKNESDLNILWEKNILPLIQEYFYGDRDKIKYYENKDFLKDESENN